MDIHIGKTMDLCEHDIKEIKNLIKFRKELLRQQEEEKNLTYEERIKRYLKHWKGEQ